jgi:hypothetical protein
VLLWPSAPRAYRPFDATDAGVAGRGELELELGPLGVLHQGPARTLVAPSLVLNWGFAERWEAIVEGRRLVRLDGGGDERSRVDDTALAVKTVVREGSLQERTGPSIATELAAMLPEVGARGGAGVEWTLVVSQRFRAATVHVCGAAAWTRAHEPGGFASTIVEGPLAWAVRPVAEVFAEGERGEGPTFSALAGAIWRVADRLSIDAALRRAREGGERATELRAGLTWAFHVGAPRGSLP